MEPTLNQPMPEYLAAFRGAKRAKNLCLFALFLAIVVQGGCFVAVRFCGVIDANQKRSGPRVSAMQPRSGVLVGVTAPAGEDGATEATDEAKPDKGKPDKKAEPGKGKPDRARPDKAEPGKGKPDRARPDKAEPGKGKPDRVRPRDRAVKAGSEGVPDATPADPRPKPLAASQAPTDDQVRDAIMWQETMSWALYTTKLLAPLVAMLLLVSILLAVSVSLLGRLGGISGLVSAFFWAALLMALLMPWQRILNDDSVWGATYELGELIEGSRKVIAEWGAATPSTVDQSLYYARFAGLPGITLLIWLTVAVRFSSGCKGAAGLVPEGPGEPVAAEDEGPW